MRPTDETPDTRNTEIRPIQRINSADEVYSQMRDLLLDGSWTPGMRLPSENDLATRFGVSRVTIRAAIQKLKALHLVETRVGSGSYVSEIKSDQTLNKLIPFVYLAENSNLEIFQYRNIIECGSIPLAIANETPQDLEALEVLLRRMQHFAMLDDSSSFASTDLEFHLKIGQMTKNPLIIRTNEILSNVLRRSMVDVVEQMRYHNGLDYHRRILDAMIARDTEKATAIMHEHIQANYDYFK